MGTLGQKNMKKLEIIAHYFISDVSEVGTY